MKLNTLLLSVWRGKGEEEEKGGKSTEPLFPLRTPHKQPGHGESSMLYSIALPPTLHPPLKLDTKDHFLGFVFPMSPSNK